MLGVRLLVPRPAANRPQAAAAAPPLMSGGGDAHTDLMRRIWFTLGALLVYVLGMNIPLPRCNVSALLPGGLFPMRMYHPFDASIAPFVSVFSLGVMPYIWALVSIHLLALASDRLRALKNGDVSQRKQFNTYTRYLALLIAGYQAYAMSIGLEAHPTSFDPVVIEPGHVFRLSTVATLSAGTMFLVWLGHEITRRGIGNGISLLVFASLVPAVPGAIADLVVLARTGGFSATAFIGIFVLLVALIAAIIILQRAHMRVPVVSPHPHYEGVDSLSLTLNPTSIIPPAITLAVLATPYVLIPIIVTDYPEWIVALIQGVGRGQPLHLMLYFGLVVLVAHFGRKTIHDPQMIAQRLERTGSFLPGLRPGAATARHIDHTLARLAPIGGVWLAVVCLLPEVVLVHLGLPFAVGGFSLILMTLAALEFIDDLRGRLKSARN